MAVNDTRVRQLIDDYLGRNLGNPDPLDRTEIAFRQIKAARQAAGASADEDMAAAEHYLFARYMVSNGVVSVTQMRAMVMGYDGVKFLAQQNETTEKMMRHNPANPTSAVSAASVAWGMQGCSDGEEDRLKHAPKRAVLTWNWDAMKFGGITDRLADWGKSGTRGNY